MILLGPANTGRPVQVGRFELDDSSYIRLGADHLILDIVPRDHRDRGLHVGSVLADPDDPAGAALEVIVGDDVPVLNRAHLVHEAVEVIHRERMDIIKLGELILDRLDGADSV